MFRWPLLEIREPVGQPGLSKTYQVDKINLNLTKFNLIPQSVASSFFQMVFSFSSLKLIFCLEHLKIFYFNLKTLIFSPFKIV